MTPVWGLAAAGSIGRSLVPRLPKLAHQLGPVISTSYRLAARIANTLRAGTPVREFEALGPAQVILLCVPDAQLSPLVEVDALCWKGKLVIICDSPDDPQLRDALQQRGAEVGSITQIADLPDRYFVVGSRAGIHLAKSMVRSVHGTAVEVPQEGLLLFQSALTLAGSLFTPLLETAVECLRQSGLEKPEAALLAESMFQHSLRTFKHAGRKSWSGPIALGEEQVLIAQEKALQAVKPLMASYFHDAARYSFDLYQTFPELTRYNKNRWKEFRKRQHPPS